MMRPGVDHLSAAEADRALEYVAGFMRRAGIERADIRISFPGDGQIVLAVAPSPVDR